MLFPVYDDIYICHAQISNVCHEFINFVISQFHQGLKKFECQECDMKLIHYTLLAQQVYRIDRGRRDFECKQLKKKSGGHGYLTLFYLREGQFGHTLRFISAKFMFSFGLFIYQCMDKITSNNLKSIKKSIFQANFGPGKTKKIRKNQIRKSQPTCQPLCYTSVLHVSSLVNTIPITAI